MATHAELYNLQRSSTLANRFEIAAQLQAILVFNESTGTANHTERRALAVKVLTNPTTAAVYGELFKRVALVSNATIQDQGEAATDAQITTAVSALWTALAVNGL